MFPFLITPILEGECKHNSLFALGPAFPRYQEVLVTHSLRSLSKSNLILSEPLPLTKHPAAVYLNSLDSDESQRIMRAALNVMARLLTDGECDALTLNWAQLRYQHTAALRAILKKKYAPATANRMLCALRRVLKEALRLDLIDFHDYNNAADLAQIEHETRVQGRLLSVEEIRALLGVCLADLSPLGVRDAALIAILRGSGARRSEIAALNIQDYYSNGQLNIKRGKGRKQRIVYLPSPAQSLVNQWLELRGRRKGALLCPIERNGTIAYRHLCDHALAKILKKRATEAGLEAFCAHDFRRTYISELLDAGIDIITVQKLVGHTSPETTAIYDRRKETAKQKAVELINW